MLDDKATLAVVAIGRNEGERLIRCLQSAQRADTLLVYVDSGSTDDSVPAARELGAVVVELAQDEGFSAARARNAGFNRALEISPELELVQFVDGDCEIVADWIAKAAAFLAANDDVAAVAGWRRERFPDRSIYNQLCDWEWTAAPGPARYIGGDVMMRASALQSVSGYRDSLIAGEEPELCVRLRAAGWVIHVLPESMTLHDAAMTRFSQWWRRMVRSGYAYAAGAWLHGSAPGHHWVWESARAWLWAAAIPAGVITLATIISPFALVGFLIYPAQVLRLARKESGAPRMRFIRAFFSTLSRFPEWIGQCRFLRDLAVRRTELIEYK